jgi:hypothetical protein
VPAGLLLLLLSTLTFQKFANSLVQYDRKQLKDFQVVLKSEKTEKTKHNLGKWGRSGPDRTGPGLATGTCAGEKCLHEENRPVGTGHPQVCCYLVLYTLWTVTT